MVGLTLADAFDTLVSMRLHRQTARPFRRLAKRIGSPLSAELFRIGSDRLAAISLEMRPFDDAIVTMNRRRPLFHPPMEVFIDELGAPPGSWGVTSAQTPSDVDPGTV